MVFWMFCLLCLARSYMGVIIDGMDCSLNCVCCKGGVDLCGFHPSSGNNYCSDGCIDGIYGHRCHNACPGNCSSCELSRGLPCHSCKATFYDTTSVCSKSCSVGCDGGVCDDDGTCSTCKSNFEGTKCETCIQGKYGSSCTQYCTNQNCRCSTETDCTSCKTGFYGRSTFCQTPCSPGCQEGVCNDDGSCKCRAEYTGNTCIECQSGYYGVYCNIPCSVGCVNGLCSKDGNCSCHPNFEAAKCDTCADGRYGVNCDEICSVGCTKRSCDRSNGFCKCLPNFSGDKCDQCISGFYEQLCNLPCSDNCNERTCSRYQGNCTHECVDGYSGQNCTTPCDKTCASCLQHAKSVCLSCNEGFYHDNESCISCSRICRNGQCNSVTSACTNGCAEVFWGDKCDIQCGPNCKTCKLDSGICLSCKDKTYHGLFCNISCSTSCLESKCEQKTGYCSKGCSRDSFGSMCDSKCPKNCQQGDTETSCNIDGECLYGCINDLEGRDCLERRIYIVSPTNIATAALSGVLGILLICAVAGCYLWNRRRSTPSVSEQEDHHETEMSYEQLQRQANEPTYTNVDESYSVLSL